MAARIAELTEAEAKLAQMLGDVWNEYVKLPVEHPTEQREFCTAIHACQDMILARSGRRAFHATNEVDSNDRPDPREQR